MFKFLRRYSKWILAVGGTLLLITFLVPFAFQGLGQMAATRGATWATVGADGAKVSMYDHQQLQREMRIVELLNPGAVHPIQIKTPQHWYLLTREGENAGLVGGIDDARSMLGENPSETLNAIAGRTGEGPEFVLQTMAKYRGVIRLLSLYRSAGHFSDRRLRSEAKHLFHNANAQFVVIEASPDAVTEEPSEDAIAAQFEKHKDDLPGQRASGFGYKLPDRVKLEWIEIDADAVRAAVEQSPEFNDVALRKHWRRNPNFTFPEVTDGAPIPPMVRDDLKQALFTKKMEEIARFATDQLRAAARGLARTGSYYVLPEDWSTRRQSLEGLATKLQSEFGITLPAYHAIGDRWISAADAEELEGIGTATTAQFGPNPLPLPILIMQTREFGNAVDAIVQEGVASPPLTGEDGSIYFFRITATDPSRAAESAEEVRELVVRDLKRIADYENLKATMTALESEAEADGLLALVVTRPRGQFFPPQNVSLASLQTLMLQAQLGMGLSAAPSALPIVGRHEEAVRTIIDYALSLPLMVPVSELAPAQKILPVPVDDKLALLMVELKENRPLTREDFTSGVDLGVMQALLLNDELDDGQAIIDAFSFETLAQRHHFELSRGEDEPEENGEADEANADAKEVANAG